MKSWPRSLFSGVKLSTLPNFLYAFQGGANHFLHVFQGGQKIFNGIFYVWPHTCPITIASSQRFKGYQLFNSLKYKKSSSKTVFPHTSASIICLCYWASREIFLYLYSFDISCKWSVKWQIMFKAKLSLTDNSYYIATNPNKAHFYPKSP